MHAGATPYEPEREASAIWRQLSAVEMRTGEVAQLPTGAGSLVWHIASGLLVRGVYAKFWTLVNNLSGDPYRLSVWAGPRRTLLSSLLQAMRWPSGAVFITGTPGIGMSSILLYFLWQLARAKAKVVLHTEDRMLLFSG